MLIMTAHRNPFQQFRDTVISFRLEPRDRPLDDVW